MRHVATRTGGSYPHKPTAGADQPPHEEEADTGAADGSEDMRLEQLYEQIAWPLAEKYGHTYDAFKLALTYVLIVSIVRAVANIEIDSEPSTVFDELKVPPATLEVLIATISRRLTPQPIKLRADIELTCYNPAGIDAIKRALRAGEAVSTETVPIKARLVAPPLYVLGSNATDKVSTTVVHFLIPFFHVLLQYAAIERLDKAIERIQASIEEDGGELVVKMKVIQDP
jgi:translation initiation factor 2 subunit 1